MNARPGPVQEKHLFQQVFYFRSILKFVGLCSFRTVVLNPMPAGTMAPAEAFYLRPQRVLQMYFIELLVTRFRFDKFIVNITDLVDVEVSCTLTMYEAKCM